MIEINNVQWNNLKDCDIESFLAGFSETESSFFEFKSSGLSNKSLSKEISALSNTYGGYIFIGVNNDKSLSGLGDWDEERIHNVIYNTISPLPLFSIKVFQIGEDSILVLRIEEGPIPPYISNDGHIYQRLSSGSYPIKDANSLLLLYNKRSDNDIAIASKIEYPAFATNNVSNLVGCLDLGFVLYCSGVLDFEKEFNTFDVAPVAKEIQEIYPKASVTIIGKSLVINFNLINTDGDRMIPAGIEANLEVYNDGSVRMRLPLVSNNQDGKVDISPILGAFNCIQRIYRILIKNDLIKKFIYARKYNRLQLLYEIEPNFDYIGDQKAGTEIDYAQYVSQHKDKYGLNRIVNGNRVPTSGFQIIDKAYIEGLDIPYNLDSLIDQLFYSHFELMGFIDSLTNNMKEESTDIK